MLETKALLPELIRSSAEPLADIGDERFAPMFDRFPTWQFDAWVWFDETSAVTPLPGEQRPGAEETYPFGL